MNSRNEKSFGNRREVGRNPQNNKEGFDNSKIYVDYFKKIILNVTSLREDYDEYINKCKKYAKCLKDERLTTSQIRKIYSDIMNAEKAMDLKRLRPRLAYIVGKNENKSAIRSLIDILDSGIEKLNVNDDKEEIKSLKEFIETIVAYRKYYGDRN